MGIIQNLQNYVLKLQNKILILEDKIQSLQLTVANLSTYVPNIKQTASSPVLTKTLDSNNIWVGDKGETEYTNIALLDVYYDSVDDLWRPFEAIAGTVPTLDADYEVTMIWDSVNSKYIVYKNPPYAIYYPA